MGATNAQPHWLTAFASALFSLRDNCARLQEHDYAEALATLTSADIERRQSLDRITQEADDLAAFAEALANEEPLEAALAGIRLESIRNHLSGEVPPDETGRGEPELF